MFQLVFVILVDALIYLNANSVVPAVAEKLMSFSGHGYPHLYSSVLIFLIFCKIGKIPCSTGRLYDT